jgi:hypothetical protein
MPQLTRQEWRMVAVGALLAALALLIVSTRSIRQAEADGVRARARLALVSARLDSARSLVAAGVNETVEQRRRIDSLWTVINQLRAAQRVRQRTTTVSAPTWDVVTALQAERDTAIADRDQALAQLEVMRATAGEIRRTALIQLVQDSSRLVRIGVVLDSATTGITQAERALRPRWHVRLGRGLKVIGEKVLIGGGGYLIGRLT